MNIDERTIKVLKNFEKRLQNQGWDTDNFEIAYEALEKQIPKKVSITGSHSQSCPMCDSAVNWHYCKHCGQKLSY